MKACKRCGTVKPLAAFVPNSRAPDGTFATCRECVAEKKRNSAANLRKSGRAAFTPYGVQPEWTRWVCARISA